MFSCRYDVWSTLKSNTKNSACNRTSCPGVAFLGFFSLTSVTTAKTLKTLTGAVCLFWVFRSRRCPKPFWFPSPSQSHQLLVSATAWRAWIRRSSVSPSKTPQKRMTSLWWVLGRAGWGLVALVLLVFVTSFVPVCSAATGCPRWAPCTPARGSTAQQQHPQHRHSDSLRGRPER